MHTVLPPSSTDSLSLARAAAGRGGRPAGQTARESARAPRGSPAPAPCAPPPPPLAGYARRAGHARPPRFRGWWGRCVGLGLAPERVGGGGKRARGALVDREHLHPSPARRYRRSRTARGGEGASGFCAPSHIILSCRAAGRTISWASASSAAWSPTSPSISGSSSFRPRSRSRSHTCAARAVSGACEKRRPARWGHVPAVQHSSIAPREGVMQQQEGQRGEARARAGKHP